jgi:hypothetical protein
LSPSIKDRARCAQAFDRGIIRCRWKRSCDRDHGPDLKDFRYQLNDAEHFAVATFNAHERLPKAAALDGMPLAV